MGRSQPLTRTARARSGAGTNGTHPPHIARMLAALEVETAFLSDDDDRELAKVVDNFIDAVRSLRRRSRRSDPVWDALSPSSDVAAASSSDVQPVQDILNCIPDAHVVTSVDGTIQLMNQRAAHLFNLSQDESTGCSLRRVFGEEQWAMLTRRLDGFTKERQYWQGEVAITPPARSTRSVVCTLSALWDASDQLVGAHWLLWDITEHRQGVLAQEFSEEIGQRLLAGMQAEQVVAVMCRRIVDTFGYPWSWVGAREVGGGMRVLAQAGERAPGQPYPFSADEASDRPLCSVFRAAREGASQVLRVGADVRDGESAAELAWLRREGYTSSVSVPLASGTDVLGVLSLYSHERDAFDPATIRWLEQACGQLGKTLARGQHDGRLRLQEQALNVAQHAVCVMSPQGQIEWVNEAYCRLTGDDAQNVIGTARSSIQSKHFRQMLEWVADPAEPTRTWKGEVVEHHRDGRQYTVEETLTPLVSEQGRVLSIVAILQDITDRKAAEARMLHRVYHDSLTDLPNRVMFQDRLEQAVAQARRHRRILAILFIDLDNFKQVNDDCGHDVGDRLLRIVAERLSRCVRATDTVARLSGDEFTVILQDLEQEEDVQHVAQKVLDCLGEPVQIERRKLHLRTSIGISLCSAAIKEPNALLREADRAMYRAKQQGGQCWVFASP